LIHITKIHKQRKSTTEPAFVTVLALAGPRRQESPPPALGHALRWRLGRPLPAPVWAAAAGRLLAAYGWPHTAARRPAPVCTVLAGMRRRQLAVPHARRPAPARRLAGPRPRPCGGLPGPARAGEGRIEGS